jgi:predicted GNAT family acetyltransferase
MKKLTENDRERILEYVGHEPEVNIFFIGDIENFGVDSEEVGIYAHDINGFWDSLVLLFQKNCVVYSQNPAYDAGLVAGFLKTQDIGMISGKADLIARLADNFPDRRYRTTVMTKCQHVLSDFGTPDGIDLRRLTPDDAETVVDLMMRVDEFSDTYKDRAFSVTKLRKNLACGTLGFGAFKDGAVVAVAQATAGNSQSAMLVGVATHPEERGKGYASAVVSAVCRASFDEGKEFLCLFYSNPQAGRIYNRIGFLPIGEYALFN